MGNKERIPGGKPKEDKPKITDDLLGTFFNGRNNLKDSIPPIKLEEPTKAIEKPAEVVEEVIVKEDEQIHLEEKSGRPRKGKKNRLKPGPELEFKGEPENKKNEVRGGESIRIPESEKIEAEPQKEIPPAPKDESSEQGKPEVKKQELRIDFYELDFNELEEELQKLNPKELAQEINNFIEDARNTDLEKLTAEQLDFEGKRVSRIGNVARKMIRGLRRDSMSERLHNQLNILGKLYDELEQVYIRKTSKSEKKTENQSELDKKAQEVLDKINKKKESVKEAGKEKEKTEKPRFTVGDKVMWESQGVAQWKDAKNILRIDEYRGKQFAFFEGSDTGVPMEQLKKIISESATRTEAKEKPEEKKEEEKPLTILEKVKLKEQEIEIAEQKMALYRPIGWFHKKPVVKSLNYYATESSLKKLKSELEELRKERKHEIRNISRPKEQKKEIETTIPEKTEEENPQTKKSKNKILGKIIKSLFFRKKGKK